LTCTFLCALCSTQISAQSTEKRADSLFAAKNYEAASLEYERAYFISKNSQALYKKGLSQKQELKFKQALASLQRVQPWIETDSVIYQVYYERSICAYLAEDYTEAKNQIQIMKYLIHDSLIHDQILFLEILNLNELRQWDEASILFSKYIQKNNVQAEVEDYYGFMDHPHLKNENTASILSTFIPGSGQIYAGDAGDGFISLGFQIIALGYAGLSFYQGYFINGFVSGFGLFQRFYFGGIINAAEAAQKHNYLKAREYNDKIKFLIVQTEQSGK